MQKYLLPIWLLTLTNVHLLCSCNRQKSIYLYELQNLEVLYRSNFRKNQKLHLQYKLLNLVFLFFLGFYNKKYLQPIITQYFIDNKSEIWLLFLIAHSKR